MLAALAIDPSHKLQLLFGYLVVHALSPEKKVYSIGNVGRAVKQTRVKVSQNLPTRRKSRLKQQVPCSAQGLVDSPC